MKAGMVAVVTIALLSLFVAEGMSNDASVGGWEAVFDPGMPYCRDVQAIKTLLEVHKSSGWQAVKEEYERQHALRDKDGKPLCDRLEARRDGVVIRVEPFTVEVNDRDGKSHDVTVFHFRFLGEKGKLEEGEYMAFMKVDPPEPPPPPHTPSQDI